MAKTVYTQRYKHPKELSPTCVTESMARKGGFLFQANFNRRVSRFPRGPGSILWGCCSTRRFFCAHTKIQRSLEMTDIVVINGKEIEKVEYRQQPVITMPMIDELHQRPKDTAGRNFRQNKDRFIENQDYFVVPYEEWSDLGMVRRNSSDQSEEDSTNNQDRNTSEDFIRRNSSDEKRGYAGDMTFLTRTGYLMLVKSFNDDLAWKIQRQLVNRYFETKPLTAAPQKNIAQLMTGAAGIVAKIDSKDPIRSKAALRTLHFFTGMSVDDLVEEVEVLKDPTASEVAPVISEYLRKLMFPYAEVFDVEIGKTPDGYHYLQCTTTQLDHAFQLIRQENHLPRFYKTINQLGMVMSREADALEFFGWFRTGNKKIAKGTRYHRYEYIPIVPDENSI